MRCLTLDAGYVSYICTCVLVYSIYSTYRVGIVPFKGLRETGKRDIRDRKLNLPVLLVALPFQINEERMYKVHGTRGRPVTSKGKKELARLLESSLSLQSRVSSNLVELTDSYGGIRMLLL